MTNLTADDLLESMGLPSDMRPTAQPCVNDLLRHSTRNPIVKACLQYWRMGHCSLEQALVMMACHLAEQNERLAENAVMQLQKQPLSTPLIVKDGG